VASCGDAGSQRRLESAGLLPQARNASLRHDCAGGGYVGFGGIRYDAAAHRANDLPRFSWLHGRAIQSDSCDGGVDREPASSADADAPEFGQPDERMHQFTPHPCRARTPSFDPELKTR